MATKTTTELKVFLNGSLTDYQALSDKTGTVFFDETTHGVYAEGKLIVQTLVKGISVSGSTLTIFYASGLQESIDFSIPDVFVRFDGAQDLEPDEKAQARTNIGAVSTDELATELAKKVDKVDGKGLSQEDFTTRLKNKLSGLENYDDTTIKAAVESLQTQLNTLVGGEDVEGAIDTFNEIIAFLKGIEEETLEGIITSIETQIATLSTRLTTAEGNIITNTNNISALTGRLNDFGTNLDTLSEDLSTLQGTVSFQGNQISGLVTEVDNLKMKDYTPKVWEF